MSKNHRNNGYAFPQALVAEAGTVRTSLEQGFPGMHMRDWFAGLAMQGLLANPELGNTPANLLSKWAYETADAMLEEGA